jgi:hypothetical protein
MWSAAASQSRFHKTWSGFLRTPQLSCSVCAGSADERLLRVRQPYRANLSCAETRQAAVVLTIEDDVKGMPDASRGRASIGQNRDPSTTQGVGLASMRERRKSADGLKSTPLWDTRPSWPSSRSKISPWIDGRGSGKTLSPLSAAVRVDFRVSRSRISG